MNSPAEPPAETPDPTPAALKSSPASRRKTGPAKKSTKKSGSKSRPPKSLQTTLNGEAASTTPAPAESSKIASLEQPAQSDLHEQQQQQQQQQQEEEEEAIPAADSPAGEPGQRHHAVPAMDQPRAFDGLADGLVSLVAEDQGDLQELPELSERQVTASPQPGMTSSAGPEHTSLDQVATQSAGNLRHKSTRSASAGPVAADSSISPTPKLSESHRRPMAGRIPTLNPASATQQQTAHGAAQDSPIQMHTVDAPDSSDLSSDSDDSDSVGALDPAALDQLTTAMWNVFGQRQSLPAQPGSGNVLPAGMQPESHHHSQCVPASQAAASHAG